MEGKNEKQDARIEKNQMLLEGVKKIGLVIHYLFRKSLRTGELCVLELTIEFIFVIRF
jgi:hypothetical protein